MKIDFNEFQAISDRTAVYPNRNQIAGLVYTVLGLTGEAGELANKLKKHLRSETPVDKEVLMDELSDVLWYVGAVATELGYDLQTVAEFNIDKLQRRKAANQLKDHD